MGVCIFRVAAVYITIFLSISFPGLSHASNVELKKQLDQVRDTFGKCLVNSQVGLQSTFNSSVAPCEEEVKKKFPEMHRYQIVMKDPYKNSMDGNSHGGIYHKTGNLISLELHVEAQELRGKGQDQKTVILESSGPVIHTFNVKADDEFCKACEVLFGEESGVVKATNVAREVLTRLQDLTQRMAVDIKECEQGILDYKGLKKTAEGCEYFCESGYVQFSIVGKCESCEENYKKNVLEKNKYLGLPYPVGIKSFANQCLDENNCYLFAETWNKKTEKCEKTCGIGQSSSNNGCKVNTDYCNQKFSFHESTTKFERPPFAQVLEGEGCDVEEILKKIKQGFFQNLEKSYEKCSENMSESGYWPFELPGSVGLFGLVKMCENQTNKNLSTTLQELEKTFQRYYYPQPSSSY